MYTLGLTINVVEWIQSFQSGFLDFFFIFISFTGEQYVYITVLGIVYWTYNKKFGEFIGMSLAFTAVVNNTLKELVNAPRPYTEYPDRVTNLRSSTSTGMSFPSGHTQTFSTFLFALAFYIKKKWLFITASILVVLMMTSRIYLGVHYLEDVIVAAILGLIIAYVLHYYYDKIYENKLLLHKIYIIIILISLPITLILGSEDLFKGFGIMTGVALSVMFEKKYVNFTLNVSLIKKVIRVIIGLVIMLSLQVGLKEIYSPFVDEGTYLFDVLTSIRYFSLTFIGLGLYPILFKKNNFKR